VNVISIQDSRLYKDAHTLTTMKTKEIHKDLCINDFGIGMEAKDSMQEGEGREDAAARFD